MVIRNYTNSSHLGPPVRSFPRSRRITAHQLVGAEPSQRARNAQRRRQLADEQELNDSAAFDLAGINTGLASEDERTHEEKIRQVEAVVFLAKDGISHRKIAKMIELESASEAKRLLKTLNERFVEHHRPYKIEEMAGGFAMLTRPQFAPWLRKLNQAPKETKLSQTAVETLAIVAYRQPVLRAEIEAIRGVGCSEVLKQLMELDLVRISGRSEELGRPYLYGTTKRFLQTFGLRSTDQLPKIES